MGFIIGFFSALLFELVLLALLRFIGFYIIVQESTCKVFVLWGNVVGVIDEPGLHLLWPKLLFKAPLVRFFGAVHTLDMRLDQRYLRSQPVNSEEGAPMGVGIWYEMFISDPVAFLFKNVDPEGSLAANVSNATVRCLSNMPLGKLLEDRHSMSQTVRSEVSHKSHDWGYRLGSVYIRKVHFRDHDMIRQIESKVVNRLRQVTSAIRQEGENQVNIITSSAQREASVEFAKAGAIRPKIVATVLRKISAEPEVSKAIFDILEIQRVLESGAEVILVPPDGGVLTSMLAGGGSESGGEARRSRERRTES